jgi:hypothetical protein
MIHARTTVHSITPGRRRGQADVHRMARRPSALRCLRWAAKSLAQESTSGCCLSSACRWRSVMPPQTPNSIWLSSASARHSAMTGQCRQITVAFRCAAPPTNQRRVRRDRLSDTAPSPPHAMRPSPELLNNACRHLFQQPVLCPRCSACGRSNGEPRAPPTARPGWERRVDCRLGNSI